MHCMTITSSLEKGITLKMYSNALFLVFSTILLSVHINANHSPTETLQWPFSPDEVPFLNPNTMEHAPGPLDIESSDATFIDVKPFHIICGLNEKWLVNQTNTTLEIRLDQPTAIGTVFGGVLHNEVYRIRKLQFYWHDNFTNFGHAAATSIDGQGARLEASVYYYNIKYGSFENAINYPDGLVDLLIRLNVKGLFPNPLFCPLQYELDRFKGPSTATIPSAFSYLFYSFFPHHDEYYAYPGTYMDQETGKSYPCTTTIVLPLVPLNFISWLQFKDTFGKLVTASGKPLIGAVRQYPDKSVKVVKAKGIYLVNRFNPHVWW